MFIKKAPDDTQDGTQSWYFRCWYWLDNDDDGNNGDNGNDDTNDDDVNRSVVPPLPTGGPKTILKSSKGGTEQKEGDMLSRWGWRTYFVSINFCFWVSYLLVLLFSPINFFIIIVIIFKYTLLKYVN